MEVAMDKRMRGKKALSLPRRFKSLHLAFSTSCRTMRVLSPIVQISALSVFNLGEKLALCHAVASQLVGHDHARHILKTFQQPSKESFGGFGIPPRLDEDVEHDAILIHRTPKIVLHALNPDEHLVEVPLISWSRASAAKAFGKALAEFPAPAPNGLIGHENATLSQQEFNVS
jgi:hypothetical protein